MKLCSLSAVCRTALWRNASPSTTKRRGEREAEEGLKVLRLVLKYDHKDPQLPDQSCVREARGGEGGGRGGDALLGCKAAYRISGHSTYASLTICFVQSSCNLSTVRDLIQAAGGFLRNKNKMWSLRLHHAKPPESFGMCENGVHPH